MSGDSLRAVGIALTRCYMYILVEGKRFPLNPVACTRVQPQGLMEIAMGAPRSKSAEHDVTLTLFLAALSNTGLS